MLEKALAVIGLELGKACGYGALQVFKCAGCGLAQMGLELREGQLDGI